MAKGRKTKYQTHVEPTLKHSSKDFDGKREISIGFLSDVVAESGTYSGQIMNLFNVI
ncbi:hypothetical protein QUF84_00245 [Fictibacillus enclensis]|uniref:hypothetical protein n=1 Tax=Fictibacillus enclensis TaxID=1017270 RepID=UPI0025A09AFE|nr:hypothetical protein [Fictibacillus enclensis]MDM5335726.1 hypothetical protein [Fictibacillus enclensis]